MSKERSHTRKGDTWGLSSKYPNYIKRKVAHLKGNLWSLEWAFKKQEWEKVFSINGKRAFREKVYLWVLREVMHQLPSQ
jgi:hypothetical protein